MKPILCLDFDGVVHSYTSGWKGADVIPDAPVGGAFDFIREADEYFDVQIFSSRSHQPGGIQAMKDWCTKYANSPLPVTFPQHKPSAMVSIDDRAVTFEGAWPNVKVLTKFKPWNKR